MQTHGLNVLLQNQNFSFTAEDAPISSLTAYLNEISTKDMSKATTTSYLHVLEGLIL